MSDFFEQYKRPEWQRKRLEVMGATDKTLNVHHAHYVRGRMPWEYDAESLRCLCEECHQVRHDQLKLLKLTVGHLDPDDVSRLIGYLRGLDLQHYAKFGEDRVARLNNAEESQGLAEAFAVHYGRGYTVADHLDADGCISYKQAHSLLSPYSPRFQAEGVA